MTAVRPELFLRDASGKPIPPAELSTRIAQQIGPGWFLRYLSAAWAVCRTWPPNDRRWEGVKTGENDPAFAWDIIGYLPMECAVDEAPAYLERMLRTDSRADVQAKSHVLGDWNALEVPKQLAEDVIQATRDVMGAADEVQSAIYATTPATPSKKKPKGKRKPMTI